VLRKVSRIRISIEDDRTPVVTGPGDYADMTYFRPVVFVDDFIAPADAAAVETLSLWTGVKIRALDDLKHAFEVHVDRHLAAGAIGLKCALAYQRAIRFEKATAAQAEADLARLLKGPAAGAPPASARPWRNLEDHMMHFVCALADKRGLFMQIHTGLQEGGSRRPVADAEPSQLANLFLEYQNARFDVFHIGYPYQQTVAGLAKNLRNVNIDFAWAHILSPEAAVRALIEYLDAVPANKISGFGGDFLYIDGVAGHAHIARENIAKALYFKVKHGAFDLDRAKELARMILVDNPTRIFGLGA
jgi:predicted TIM-barrel fold metal-dependent hydrolase